MSIHEIIGSLKKLELKHSKIREEAIGAMLGLMIMHFKEDEFLNFGKWIDKHDENLNASPLEVIVNGEYERFKKIEGLEKRIEDFDKKHNTLDIEEQECF